jgi:hypothetical protein
MYLINKREQTVNTRTLNHETDKMSDDKKQELVDKLNKELTLSKTSPAHSTANGYQDTDFENPFNTRAPELAPRVRISLGYCLKCDMFISIDWNTLYFALVAVISSKMHIL